MPDAKFSYYTNAKHKWHARWEDAIGRDLKSDVDSRFPVLKDRQHTGVAGNSMGGYAAAKLALKYPDRYGFAGVMSGALDITTRRASLRRWGQTWRIWTIFGFRGVARSDEDVFKLLASSASVPQTTWFISCGERDPLYYVNYRFVRELGRHGVNLQLTRTSGGHDWTSWNSAIPDVFRHAATAFAGH
jgi:S-formylglutathione hydrolase FrmB